MVEGSHDSKFGYVGYSASGPLNSLIFFDYVDCKIKVIGTLGRHFGKKWCYNVVWIFEPTQYQ